MPIIDLVECGFCGNIMWPDEKHSNGGCQLCVCGAKRHQHIRPNNRNGKIDSCPNGTGVFEHELTEVVNGVYPLW